MKSVLKILRSRRLATGLILVMAVYVGVLTAIPQRGPYSEDSAEWTMSGEPFAAVGVALGLDHGTSNAFFYVLVAMITASTAACTLERTTHSLRLWRGRGVVSAAIARRLEQAPHIRVDAPVSPDDARGTVIAALEKLGLKPRVGPRVAYAEAGAWGLWGSPVFHWCMVASIVVISLGAMTRWEGLIGVPEGHPVVDERAAYGKLNPSPLAPPHTGWSLELRDVETDYRRGEVSYGFTPTIAIVDGDRELAFSRVYANHPLRHGPLLVHSTEHGLSLVAASIDPSGVVHPIPVALIDFDGSSASGTTAQGFDLAGSGSVLASVSVEVMARDRTGALPRLRPPNPIAVVHVDSADGTSRIETTSVGGTVEVGEGWKLRIADIGYYARLTVVRDWSVTWLYAFMGIGMMALTITALVPYRAVWLQVTGEGGTSMVSIVVRHYRRDHQFTADVEHAVRSSLGVSGEDSNLPIPPV